MRQETSWPDSTWWTVERQRAALAGCVVRWEQTSTAILTLLANKHSLTQESLRRFHNKHQSPCYCYLTIHCFCTLNISQVKKGENTVTSAFPIVFICMETLGLVRIVNIEVTSPNLWLIYTAKTFKWHHSCLSSLHVFISFKTTVKAVKRFCTLCSYNLRNLWNFFSLFFYTKFPL